jgi:type IV pilus assembly protein PilC
LFRGRVKKASPQDLSVLCSQLHLMVSAGITLSEALRLTGEITKAPRIKKALKDAFAEISKGEQLHRGFLKNEALFPSFFIYMLRFGEETGSLEAALKKMEVYFEKQGRLLDKIKSSLTYPVVVFLVSVIVMAALLTYIVPGFADTLEGLGGDLPAATRVLLSVSAFARENLFYLVFIAAAGTVFMGRYLKSENGREWMDVFKFRMPVLRTVFRHSELSGFCRNMGIMVGSGFNIIRALEVCAEISGNILFRRQILDSAALVKNGGEVCRSFSAAGIDDRLFISLVKTGEDTGSLEFMFEKAAEHYEREVENLLERYLRLLEPAVIVVMAVVIGGVIISVMLPIMSIMDTI